MHVILKKLLWQTNRNGLLVVRVLTIFSLSVYVHQW